MQKIIGVTELQRRFKSVFDEVTHHHVPYVLTRGSRPEAVLVPYDQFLRWQELDENRSLESFGRLLEELAERNAHFSEEEIAADVAAAEAEVAATRRNRYQYPHSRLDQSTRHGGTDPHETP